MAELVDAVDSKSTGRKAVRVQVPLSAFNYLYRGETRHYLFTEARLGIIITFTEVRLGT